MIRVLGIANRLPLVPPTNKDNHIALQVGQDRGAVLQLVVPGFC
jgi:hypothetical protein